MNRYSRVIKAFSKKYRVLICSASCYGAAFYNPSYLILLLGIGFIGFFRIEKISLQQKGLWWAIVDGLLAVPFIPFLLSEYGGKGALIISTLLLIYGMIITVILSLLGDCIARCSILRPYRVGIEFFLRLVYQEYFFLLPFGFYYGHPMLNPLVVLTAYPCLLYPFVGLGMIGMLALLVGTMLHIAHLLTYKSHCLRSFIGLAILVVLGIRGSFLEDPTVALVKKLRSFSYAPLIRRAPLGLEEYAEVLAHVTHELQKNRDLIYIILPESVLNVPFNTTRLATLTNDYGLSDQLLFLGAPRQVDDQKNFCTTFYVIKEGHIISWFDKELLMPFGEISSYCVVKKGVPCKGGPQERSLKGSPFIPYLCSELFLSHTLASSPYPILCAAHDLWFKGTPLPTLMMLKACLSALLHKRIILYVSYDYGFIVGANGNPLSLRGNS